MLISSTVAWEIYQSGNCQPLGVFPLFTLHHIFHKAAIYNLTTLCLNGTLPCVHFMDVTMGDIPLFHHVNTTYTIFNIKLLYIT